MAFTETVNEIASITGQSRSSFTQRLKDEFLPGWEDNYHTKVVLAKLIA